MKILNNLLKITQLLSVRRWNQTQEDSRVWLLTPDYVRIPFLLCLSQKPEKHEPKTKFTTFNHKPALIPGLSGTNTMRQLTYLGRLLERGL